MEIEERVRKIENMLSFIKGAIIVGITAFAIFMGVTSFVQIPNQIESQLDKQLSEEARNTIDKALSKANSFLSDDAHKIWPDGNYCILKSGQCLAGFTLSKGQLRAIKMFKSSDNYVLESTFGDSWIKHHDKELRKPTQNDWHGEIIISTCCK